MIIKRILTELVYFFLIVVVLALLFHSDLLTSPLVRLDKMSQMGNYLHPFLWSGILYGLIAVVRLIVAGIQILTRKKD